MNGSTLTLPKTLTSDQITELLANARKVHKVKTVPPFFSEVASGAKPFEVRNMDRGYEVGDVLILQDFDPFADSEAKGYSGHEVIAEITYVMDHNHFFANMITLKEGWGILGIRVRAILMGDNPFPVPVPAPPAKETDHAPTSNTNYVNWDGVGA